MKQHSYSTPLPFPRESALPCRHAASLRLAPALRGLASCGAAALALGLPALAADGPGGIIFIGDSITQGGQFLNDSGGFSNGRLFASYRYQLFKNFVDNGIPFQPMGTSRGAAKGVDVSALTPDYRGQSFTNVSEAAASGRSYQVCGHEKLATADYPWYRSYPGTVYPVANQGPLTLKMGQENPYVDAARATTDFVNGGTLRTYTGDTYASLYGSTVAQTACIMIGINDLLDKGAETYGFTDADIVANTGKIVGILQEYNPGIDIVVMGLLPVGQKNGAHAQGIEAYNALLEEAAASWSTASSSVRYADVSTGFYAENGAMVDGGMTAQNGAHPNAQGELIIAGNLARVLGVGQRTMGYERKGSRELAAQADFSSTVPTIRLADSPGGLAVERSFTVNKEATLGQLASDGKALTFRSPKAAGDNFLQLALDGTGGLVRTGTYSLTLRMNEAEDGNGASNMFSLFIGDGKTGVGILNVGEDGISWGSTLLYGSPYDAAASSHSFTQGELDLRIVVAEDAAASAGTFHVWLGDQLIGEGLAATSGTAVYKDKVLMGRTSVNYATYATVYGFSMELGAAYAPMVASIPEPATATLSLLALAGLAARRRRG